MQAQELENLQKKNIVNTGRPIFIPEGLHAGREIFSKIAGALGLNLQEYPLSIVKNLSDPSHSEELIHLFSMEPVLFVSPTNLKIKGNLIELARDKVFAFASVSTGTDHVDLEALERAGIHFIHAPGANSRSVVEYILAALPLIHDEERLLRGHLSLGIVGFGRIGSQLAKCLDELGFSYSFYDPFVEGRGKGTLKDVLASDVVTFHVPLTVNGDHPTKGMVDIEYVSGIPEGSLIINTSRGQIFSEESYLHACRRCRTIMDVFPIEPPTKKMIDAADLVSPHIAGYNYSARAGGTALVAKNFMKLICENNHDVQYSPGKYNIYTIDFLKNESDELKKNPDSFRNRRENYPDRGDYFDTKRFNSEKEYSGFLKKILDLCTKSS